MTMTSRGGFAGEKKRSLTRQTREQESAVDLVKKLQANRGTTDGKAKSQATTSQLDQETQNAEPTKTGKHPTGKRRDETINRLLNSGIPLERAMRFLELEEEDDAEFEKPKTRGGNTQQKNANQKTYTSNKGPTKKQ